MSQSMKNQGSPTALLVVETASNLKDALSGLVESFQLILPAIENEHNAIKSGDITIIETACIEKSVISNRIEALHLDLRAATQTIHKQHGAMCERSMRLESIQDCVAMLEDLSEAIVAASPQDRLTADLLQHLTTRIRRLTVEFEEAAARAKPKIEQNRYVVQTLLRNYQESYRFWVDLAAESQSTYSAKGVQKASNVGSTLVVRA